MCLGLVRNLLIVAPKWILVKRPSSWIKVSV